MQAAVQPWISPATSDFQLQQLQASALAATHPISTPVLHAANTTGLKSVPHQPNTMQQPSAQGPLSATGATAGELTGLLAPHAHVVRQGSLAKLLFEILDDGDTDGLLLADLQKSSQTQQFPLPPAQPPLLQQLQQQRLLERQQQARVQQQVLQQQQEGDLDIHAPRDTSAATSSSHAASAAGTGTLTTPWPSFTSAPGQPGPGALLSASMDAVAPGPAALAAEAAADGTTCPAAGQDAGAALLQQLHLQGQGLRPELTALSASAASVAQESLEELQVVTQQWQALHMDADIDQQHQQQHHSVDAIGLDSNKQQQQQGVLAPPQASTPPPAHAGSAAAAAEAAGTPSGIAVTCPPISSAAAPLGTIDLMDILFKERFRQESPKDDLLMDLHRMVSLPRFETMGTDAILLALQQQQADATPVPEAPQPLDLNTHTSGEPNDVVTLPGSVLPGTAATALPAPMDAGAAAAAAGSMQMNSVPNMDSGMMQAVSSLGRLQIPSPQCELGMGSLQGNPASTLDAIKPCMDQNILHSMQHVIEPSVFGEQQLHKGHGSLGPLMTSRPSPSCSQSGIGPSTSVPYESNGSVGDAPMGATMSDGEVDQAASTHRSSARRRAKAVLAKQDLLQGMPTAGDWGSCGLLAANSLNVQHHQAARQPDMLPQPGGGTTLGDAGSGGTVGPAVASAAAERMVQLDLQQQLQQQQQQGIVNGTAGTDGMLMSGGSGGMGESLMPSSRSVVLQDRISQMPHADLSAVLQSLTPRALHQILVLQVKAPALARVVLRRALMQLRESQQPVVHEGLEGLLGLAASNSLDMTGPGAPGTYAPASATAGGSAGAAVVFRPWVPNKGADAGTASNSTAFKARKQQPLFFRQQRSRTPMTNLNSKQQQQQQQQQPPRQLGHTGSAPLPGPLHTELLSSPPAPIGDLAGFRDASALQLDPAAAAALCAPPWGLGAAASPDAAGLHGSRSGSETASGDGISQQQRYSRRQHQHGLGKRARQITQNDLSAAVAAAKGGTAAQAAACNGLLPGNMQALQVQLQNGLKDVRQLGFDEHSTASGSNQGLAALLATNASTVTVSTGSLEGVPDAAVITQQARALVRILTKLNAPLLMQTRAMLNSVLARSAPGLLDHMGAIDRMIGQLIVLKQQQPMLSLQQQQQVLMGDFVSGSDVLAGPTGAQGSFSMDDVTAGQQHMGHQANIALGDADLLQQQTQQQTQFLQGQLQTPQQLSQVPSSWGTAAVLSGPQPVQWNSSPLMQETAPAAAAPVVGLPSGGVLDADQTPYQLATRQQRGRRCKIKADELQQQQAAALSSLHSAGGGMGHGPVSASQEQHQLLLQDMQLQQQLEYQQQQGLGVHRSCHSEPPDPPAAFMGSGAARDLLLTDVALERQAEDGLLLWLQNDDMEGWPDGEAQGVLAG